jgi:hypothetical protein
VKKVCSGFFYFIGIGYIYLVKLTDMTKQEFQKQYGEMPMFDTSDVLMRIASNLSDIQLLIEWEQNQDANARLNSIKEYIFNYQDVIRHEARMAEEMKEFNDHLGKY